MHLEPRWVPESSPLRVNLHDILESPEAVTCKVTDEDDCALCADLPEDPLEGMEPNDADRWLWDHVK